MTNQWRVSVDRDRCVGSGTCTALVPALFTLDDDDCAVPGTDLTDPGPALAQAADYCPTGAIRLTDAATGRPVTPGP